MASSPRLLKVRSGHLSSFVGNSSSQNIWQYWVVKICKHVRLRVRRILLLFYFDTPNGGVFGWDGDERGIKANITGTMSLPGESSVVSREDSLGDDVPEANSCEELPPSRFNA